MTYFDMIKLHVERNQARCGPLTHSECSALIAEVERLRARTDDEEFAIANYPNVSATCDKLKAENVRLKAALKPFAREYRGQLAIYGESDDSTGIPIMWGHLRNAAAALAKGEG